MRLRLNRLSVIPAVLFIIGTVGSSDLVAQSIAAGSARGHVDVGPPSGQGNQGIDRYSFTARLNSDGTVQGQFQLFTNVGTDFETKIHGEVTCLVVLPDGSARMGVTITASNPALPQFQPLGVVWNVRDSGEGSNAEDAGSLFLFGIPPEITAEECGNIGIPPLPSSRGNVQVSAR